jgi:adenine-specific DNA glycosylase
VFERQGNAAVGTLGEPAFRPSVLTVSTIRPDDHPIPSTYRQALMELGATLCSPRKPACDACPLSSQCRARAIATRKPKLTEEKTGEGALMQQAQLSPHPST